MSERIKLFFEDNTNKLLALGFLLLSIGLFLSIGLKSRYSVTRIHRFIPSAFIYVSIYVFYRYALEFTTKPPGKFPDIKWIIISVIFSITTIIIFAGVCASWVQVNMFYGVGSDPQVLVEAVIKLIDYLIRMGQEYKWGY